MKLRSTALYATALLFVSFVFLLSACKKETTEPEPVADNPIIGKYRGEMVTKYATATQATSQTMAVGVEIKTGDKAGEVTWVILAPLGEYNDPATATISTSGTTSTLSIPKQKQTYAGQDVTFEGNGQIEGKKLTMTLKEEDSSGKYDHQITATKP